MNRFVMLSISAILLLARTAWAQSAAAPVPGPVPGAGASDGAAASGASSTTVAILVLVVAVIAVIVVIAKMNDLRKKREDQAVQLQSQISDALLRDRSVGVSVTPTVQIPFWKGSPAHIALAGEVPSALARQVAVRIAIQEASRVRQDFEITDQIAEVRQPAARTA